VGGASRLTINRNEAHMRRDDSAESGRDLYDLKLPETFDADPRVRDAVRADLSSKFDEIVAAAVSGERESGFRKFYSLMKVFELEEFGGFTLSDFRAVAFSLQMQINRTGPLDLPGFRARVLFHLTHAVVIVLTDKKQIRGRIEALEGGVAVRVRTIEWPEEARERAQGEEVILSYLDVEEILEPYRTVGGDLHNSWFESRIDLHIAPWVLKHRPFFESLSLEQFVQWIEFSIDWARDNTQTQVDLLNRIMPILDSRPEFQDRVLARMATSWNKETREASEQVMLDVIERRTVQDLRARTK
jgi:hypothetical protein